MGDEKENLREELVAWLQELRDSYPEWHKGHLERLATYEQDRLAARRCGK